tara:strand:- start:12741 stop:13361 length:621 start_codon:yes stop_codon:yes gene_type:complete
LREDLEQSNPVQIYSTEVSYKQLHINLNSEIKEAYHYGDINQHLRSLGEGDIVHLHINSPGGALDSAIELVYNLQKCPATVIGYLGADASSAGSMIFLACDDWEIHPLSTMMIHNGTAGSFGSIPEMRNRTEHLDALLSRVLDTFYAGFLSEQEIERHIAGRVDQYMFAEEIEQRLIKLEAYRVEEVKKFTQEMEDSLNDNDNDSE